MGFTPSPNVTRGNTQSSGSSHQITGSLILSSSTATSTLTMLGVQTGSQAGPGSFLALDTSDEVVLATPAGGGGGGISWDGSTANGVATYKDADEATVEPNLTFDGTTLTVTGDVTASSNISASSFYGSADNLSASYTAHDTRNPILSKLDATGKINAEQYLSYEYLSGHSYLNVCSNGSARSPRIDLWHGLVNDRKNSVTSFWSSDTPTDDPFYITRRVGATSYIYYPITIWSNDADPSKDKIGINMPYSVTASYRFDVSGSSRFQEGVTIDGSTILGAGTGSTPGIARPWIHQVSGTLSVSGSTILSGSNIFGQLASDYHQVTGTLETAGSLITNNGINPRGSAADSIQIGNNNGAVAIGSLNISFGGTVSGQGSTAIGPGNPVATAAGATALGSASYATAANAFAMGTQAVAAAAGAIALGNSATGSAANAIAMGDGAKSDAAGAITIGGTGDSAANASAANAIAIGQGATSAGIGTIAMGKNHMPMGTYSIIIGGESNMNGANYITVIGANASAGGNDAVAIGSGSNSSAASAIALGHNARPGGTGSVAIGADAVTTGVQSVVLGPTNISTANYTTLVGYNNSATVNYSIVIGDTSKGSAANAVAVGQRVLASGADSIAIGQYATASAANAIAIGSGSKNSSANTMVIGNVNQPMRLFVSGAFAQTYFSASISTVVNATCSFYNVFNYVLTNNVGITASSPIAGASYLFFFRQDGTGGRTAAFENFVWPGGTAPTLTTTAGATDIISGISDGTNIYADITKAFS